MREKLIHCTNVCESIHKKLMPPLQDVFLLLIRVYWGWSFFEAGKGKFMNWDRTVGFFTSLDLPFPELSVFLAASTEMIGGLFLLAGLASRVISIPLIFTMCMAYITAHWDELTIFSDTDQFVSAAPFTFLLASIIVFLFGPGRASLDHLIKKLWLKKE